MKVIRSLSKLYFEKLRKKLGKIKKNLTQLQIALNILQRKKVKPALHVFRYEMSSTIKTHYESKEPGFENVDGFLLFFLNNVHLV